MGSGCQTGGMVCFQIWHRTLYSISYFIFKVKFAKLVVFSRTSKDYSVKRIFYSCTSWPFSPRKNSDIRVGLCRCIYEFEHTYINSLIR